MSTPRNLIAVAIDDDLISDSISDLNEISAKAAALAKKLHVPLTSIKDINFQYLLVYCADRLECRMIGKSAPNPLYVDFISGTVGHRIRFGGGKGQLVARAVGLKKTPDAKIIDLTAGLGRDAFILASLGADVVMVERSPIIAALLSDGLARAKQESWVQDLKISLVEQDAKAYLESLRGPAPDVIFLDPMFPERSKSALVKKEMRYLHDLVGPDADARELFDAALTLRPKRIVVKRSKSAPYISAMTPSTQFLGKSTRFDVYFN